MGVDCRIYLPSDVRLQDVANAIAILAGLPATTDRIAGGGEPFDVPRVAGLRVESAALSCSLMHTINLRGSMVDGEQSHYVTFHPEADFGPWPCRELLPRSTPFWIAIGKRLVDLFGGAIDYSDADSCDADYMAKSEYVNNGSNEGYVAMQKRLLALAPITAAEMEEAAQFAAYSEIRP